MVGVHGDRGGDDPVLEAPVLGRVGGPTYDSTRLQEQTRAAQWNVTAGARFCPPRVTARRHRRPGHWVPRCLPRTRPDAPGRGDVPERRRTHRAPAGPRALRRENWAQVQDLSAHVGDSARRRGRPARVLPQPELSSATGRVRFARGLTGADRAATSRAPV